MTDPFPPEILAATVFAYTAAAFVKGATGLGFSTMCLPLLALSIGVPDTLPLLIIPSIASNLLVVRGAGHFRESVRRFWPVYLAAPPGIAVGLALLVHVGADTAAAALGAALGGYALLALGKPDMRLPSRFERPLSVPVGFLTGAVNGLTGSQVMPLVPYMLSLRLSPDRFIQATNCSFTFSSLAMAAGLMQIGLLTWVAAATSAAGLVLVWLGVTLGTMLRRRLSTEAFRRMVLMLVFVLGFILILHPLLH